jgi:hypothetical protein
LSEDFNKDSWLKLALHRGHINVDRKGNVYKAVVGKDGTKGWKQLKVRTHTATGRVYLNITFMGRTKSVLVNRIVALKYLPNPHGLPEVNHIDGVKAHNWVENLEWASRSEQERHAFATGLKSTRGSQNSNAKLTADQVLAIRKKAEDGFNNAQIAKDYGVAASTIRGVVERKTWTHI